MGVDKKVIGVLIPLIDRYYQCDLWRAISAEASRLNYKVIFFCGAVLESPISNEKESNSIYSLAKLDELAGLICVSGTLANHIGLEKFMEYLKIFGDKPIVHISLDIDHISTVVTDNYSSMKQLVQHIVGDHDYKKYLYISGPKTNPEANRRLQAFQDIMSEEAIEPTAYQIAYGDFSKESSREITYDVIDNGLFKPEVIICANDEMAIGVHTALSSLGIKMPEEIAFTGFDNIENATTFSPAFTTVHQPLTDMGKYSIRNLDKLIQGYPYMHEAIVGELIIRESCGCFNVKTEWIGKSDFSTGKARNKLPIDEVIFDVFQNELPKISQLIDPNQVGSYDATLIELTKILCTELKGELESGSFLKFYFDLNHLSMFHEGHIAKWEVYIDWLREALKKRAILNSSVALNDIFYSGAQMLGSLKLRNERKEVYDFMGMFYYSSELVMEMNLSGTESHMFEVLNPYLKSYDFKDFGVCLFDTPTRYCRNGSFKYPENVRMVLGILDGRNCEEAHFKTQDVLPPAFKTAQMNDYVIYPLFFRENHYGYVICSTDVAVKPIFRTVREQIANTLERQMVQRQLDNYNKRLEEIAIRDPMTNVLNRRGIYDYIKEIVEEDSAELCIIIGDIDKLKFINDNYGHKEGDYAIVTIANIMKEACSDVGQLGRMGGDEFICVLRSRQKDIGDQFIEDVSYLLKKHNEQSDKSYQLSISFGFAYWNPKGNKNLEDVISESDMNLYKTKKR